MQEGEDAIAKYNIILVPAKLFLSSEFGLQLPEDVVVVPAARAIINPNIQMCMSFMNAWVLKQTLQLKL